MELRPRAWPVRCASARIRGPSPVPARSIDMARPSNANCTSPKFTWPFLRVWFCNCQNVSYLDSHTDTPCSICLWKQPHPWRELVRSVLDTRPPPHALVKKPSDFTAPVEAGLYSRYACFANAFHLSLALTRTRSMLAVDNAKHLHQYEQRCDH